MAASILPHIAKEATYPGLSPDGDAARARNGEAFNHRHEINGGARLDIHLANFPKGTKTKAASSGIFAKVAVNRGKAMANADTS
ncbi:MAG: hypothetical protein ABSF11_00025 [Methylocella sp.]|jgi:hypothetical protein